MTTNDLIEMVAGTLTGDSVDPLSLADVMEEHGHDLAAERLRRLARAETTFWALLPAEPSRGGQEVFHICPYCKGDDVQVIDNRQEKDGNTRHEVVCQDVECQDCQRTWVIEYRPIHWFGFDENDNFDESPRPLPGEV